MSDCILSFVSVVCDAKYTSWSLTCIIIGHGLRIALWQRRPVKLGKEKSNSNSIEMDNSN